MLRAFIKKNSLKLGYERLDYISLYSSIKTSSKSLDMEVFSLGQSGLFLASANQGKEKNMNSALYHWKNNKFMFYQDLKTSNAQDFEFFTINNEVN